jgi:hypothetical protein
MASTFPFSFITMWIRPGNMKQKACMFCGQDATYTMFQYVRLVGSTGGAYDLDAEWARAIRKQMSGDYAWDTYRPVCDECMQQFASIQLGKRRPIQHLIDIALVAKKQRHISTSLVICCTVKSLDDEGDTWAMNAPDTTIEDVVKHLANRK